MNNPSVFISYSWDSEEHKDWVVVLANKLRENGVDAEIDEFVTQRRTVNLNRMMVENIRDKDYVLVILTEKYAEKADSFQGGVGYETNFLINDISENVERIIPIIRTKGDAKKAIPFYLRGVTYIDFSNDNYFESKFEELLYKILMVDRIEKVPLGEVPNLKPRKVSMESTNRKIVMNDSLIPNLKEITDIDKNRFMKDSYSKIIDYLNDFAEQTKLKNRNFNYEIEAISNKKSVLKLYLNGMQKCAAKIWLGSNFSREESIFLSFNNHSLDSDNSFNEMIRCEVDKNKNLKLKMTMRMYGDKVEEDANGVAIEIWKELINYLEY